MNMEKIRKFIQEVSDILEFFIALSVTIALVVSAIRFIPISFKEILTEGTSTQIFYTFVEHIFYLVIGIEFIKMLCQPDAHNVIEVLLFLIARHMIVGHNGAVDNLLSVISIAILFLLERYLKYGTLRPHNKDKELDS